MVQQRDSCFTIKEKVDTVDQEKMRFALLKALETAGKLRENAVKAGIHTEDGRRFLNSSTSIEMLVTAYADGWLQNIPAWLQPHIEKIDYENDPEFVEYTRLYKKFCGLEPDEPKKDFSKLPPRANFAQEFA